MSIIPSKTLHITHCIYLCELQMGQTALMMVQAYQKGQGDKLGIMQLLLDHGADVNKVDQVSCHLLVSYRFFHSSLLTACLYRMFSVDIQL